MLPKLRRRCNGFSPQPSGRLILGNLQNLKGYSSIISAIQTTSPTNLYLAVDFPSLHLNWKETTELLVIGIELIIKDITSILLPYERECERNIDVYTFDIVVPLVK